MRELKSITSSPGGGTKVEPGAFGRISSEGLVGELTEGGGGGVVFWRGAWGGIGGEGIRGSGCFSKVILTTFTGDWFEVSSFLKRELNQPPDFF